MTNRSPSENAVVVTGAGVALAGDAGDPRFVPKRSLRVEAEETALRRRLDHLDRKRMKLMSGDALLSHVALEAALHEAGWSGRAAEADPRCGIFVGTRLSARMHGRFAEAIAGSVLDDGRADAARYQKLLSERVNPIQLIMYLANRVATHLAISYQAQGPVRTFGGSACAVADAMIEAFHSILGGEIDRALVGGVDHGLDPVGRALEHWCGAGDGLGGAAAFLVLESEHSARSRGAHWLGRLMAAGARTGGAGEDGDVLEAAATGDVLREADRRGSDVTFHARWRSNNLALGNARLPAGSALTLEELGQRARPAPVLGLCSASDRDLAAGALVWAVS